MKRKARSRGFAAPAAVIVLVTGALTLFGLGALGLARTPAAKSSKSPASAQHHVAQPQRGLPRSAPARVSIPAIKVNGPLQRLGLNADHSTIQFPGPRRLGWYADGATPGEAGPTIIVGYIASRSGPGALYRLRALEPGDRVELRRADGKIVSYAVDQVTPYSAKTFPAGKVYEQTPQPTLRIITCGGLLRPHAPQGNTVVFGHQVAVRA
jgi:hypothetical protein